MTTQFRRFEWLNAGIRVWSIGLATSWMGAQAGFNEASFSPLAVGNRPTTPVIADVNRDGIADIIVAVEGDNGLAVLLGRPEGGFQPAQGSPFPAGKSPFSIAVADLDGDSMLDVVAVNRGSNHLTVLLGDGLGGFRAHGTTVPVGNLPHAVRIADFNQDGKPDIALANFLATTVTILLGDGSGTFAEAPGSPMEVGANPWGLAIGDFNGDGALDLAVTSRADNSVSAWLNAGEGRFVLVGEPIPLAEQPLEVTAGDWNHDGMLDLLIEEPWSGSITSLLGDGTGKFLRIGGIVPVDEGEDPWMVGVADVNLDGHLDAISARGTASLSVLLGNGAGGFMPSEGSPITQSEQVNSVAVGDLNGDGAPDLVGCGLNLGLSLWLNDIVPFALEVIAPAVVLESEGVARIKLRRTLDLDRDYSVLVSTRDGTARAGVDYTAIKVRVLFSPGQVEQEVSIPLVNDDWGIAARYFEVEFGDASHPGRLPWPLRIEVRDDDPPETIKAGLEIGGEVYGSMSLREQLRTIRFTARRIGGVDSTRRVIVHYKVYGYVSEYSGLGLGLNLAEPARLGIDFETSSVEGEFQFGPGISENSIEVTLLDDFEPDGLRSLRFQLQSSEIAVDDDMRMIEVLIQDNERSASQQQLVTDPEISRYEVIYQMPGGGTLMRNHNFLVRLTPQGLPDLSFGHGTGRVQIPDSSHFLGVLKDGRILLQDDEHGVLLRIGSDGGVDESFGGGAGRVILTGKFLSMNPDGSLLVTQSTAGGELLTKLRPDGSPDPGFLSDTNLYPWIGSTKMSPSGTIWMQAFTREGEDVLVCLESNGRKAALFEGSKGLHSILGFDPLGRVYIERGEESDLNHELDRFLEDGTRDASYHPTLPSPFRLLDIAPDGQVLAYGTYIDGVEIEPTGVVRELPFLGREFGRYLIDGSIVVAVRQQCPGGIFTDCGDDRPIFHVVDRAGELKSVGPSFGLPWPQSNQRMFWSGYPKGQLGDRTEFTVYRTDFGSTESSVGFATSGQYVLESGAGVTMQRSGPSGREATVHGRVIPWVGGKWDEAGARVIEVLFPVGQVEVELKLPWLHQAGRQPMRQYIIQLDSAFGVEIGAFSGCKLWVLDDETMAEDDRVQLERYPDLIGGHALLLIGRGKKGQATRPERRLGLKDSWETMDNYTSLGDGWVKPILIDDLQAVFYRNAPSN